VRGEEVVAGAQERHEPGAGSAHQADAEPVHRADAGPAHRADPGPAHRADPGSVHRADPRPEGSEPRPSRPGRDVSGLPTGVGLLAQPFSRRSLLVSGGAGLGVAALAGGLGASVLAPVAGAAEGAGGGYSLQTPYFSISGAEGAITSLAFSPQGTASYGPNLLAGSGLYFQFLSDGGQVVATSSAATAVTGADSLVVTIPIVDHAVVSQTEQNNGYDIADGGGVVQSFVAPDVPLTGLGLGLFSAFSARPTGVLDVAIHEDDPAGAVVFSASVPPSALAQISGGPNLTMLSLPSLSLTAGGTYVIELTSSDAAWAALYQDPATLTGGELYLGGTLKSGAELMFQLLSSTGTLEYQAVWSITASGASLSSSLVLDVAGAHTLDKLGFELVTPWEYSGYDTTDPATTPFSRFFDSEGSYFCIEQFKRRPSLFGEFSFDIGAHSSYPSAGERRWIAATGQNGYDLQFEWPDICLHFAMAADSMTFKFYQSGYATSSSGHSIDVAAGSSLSYPFTLSVSPHSEAVPDWYPAISSSNALVDRYMASFLYSRGFAWLRGAYGSDWCDWMHFALDWIDGPQRDGLRTQIEAITLSDDGYVWTFNPFGSYAWPFPGPPYDSRHFTTNGMYILGVCHYYSWTGDEEFLAKMLPRARAAMRYYLDALGGSSGLVTVDRGEVGTTGRPAHTGEDGAPGTNYWDLISYGWKDAYVNVYFYGALGALAELEAAAGEHAASESLLALRRRARQVFNDTFWVDVDLPGSTGGGRYIQTVDRRGVAHDHGATYLNLEAMRFGLPSAEQGKRILAWLDTGTTALTTNRLVLDPGGPSLSLAAGDTAVQSFLATGDFTHVAPQISTDGASNDTSEMTLSLFAGSYPDGTLVASRHYVGVYDGGFDNVLEVPLQPAEYYYLEVSETSGPIVWAGSSDSYSDGSAYHNGSALSSPSTLALVVVSPHQAGPADTYTTYGWTPRTTTRKNNFNYVWEWSGVTVPWGQQLEDGGADLYISGFDMLARTLYSSPDDAFSRLEALLGRYSLPDRLCGGSPLYLGEIPENEVSAGGVGVDVPFPESALAPACFVYAFLGLQATPSRLLAEPHLPAAMDSVTVTNVGYQGHHLTLTVDRHQVTVEGLGGPARHLPYRSGVPVVIVGAPLPPGESAPPGPPAGPPAGPGAPPTGRPGGPITGRPGGPPAGPGGPSPARR